MPEHLLHADKMAVAVSSDPQFSFPTRPRMVPGIVTVPTTEGLLVEGGPTRQFFQGPASESILPRLMSLLDGTREPHGLATELELEDRQLWPALSLLYTTGLLEEADDEGTAGAPRPTLDFLARSIDTTRVNQSGAAAYRRLTGATVDIVSDESHEAMAARVAGLLVADHVGSVRRDAAQGDRGRRADLLLALGAGPCVEEAALRARAADVLVLPAVLRESHLLIGPALEPAHHACFSCLVAQRPHVDSAGDATGDSSAEAGMPALMVVREAVSLLSRVGTTQTSRSLVATDLETWSQRTHAISPRPQCPLCMDPDGPEAGQGIPLGWAYAHAVSFPPRHTVNPRDHQVHYASTNIALQRSHRRWRAAPTVPLPRTEELGGRFDLPALAHLITRTVGLRRGPAAGADRVDRWCATGGNLGSPIAYLVARDVPGLQPGVYGFQREDDTLATLPWADPMAPLAGVADAAPAVLVLTGALDVVASKYGPFGWRIIHLDCGAALAQAAILSCEIGLSLRPIPTWDDEQLADLLGADLDREPVTAVLELGPDRSLPTSPAHDRHRRQ